MLQSNHYGIETHWENLHTEHNDKLQSNHYGIETNPSFQ